MNRAFAAAALAAATTSIGAVCAPPAHANDAMYRVGVEIPPGEYRYTVAGSWGSWRTCSDASCEVGAGCIDMSGPIDGYGATGYMTIPATAVYVKLHNLQLTKA